MATQAMGTRASSRMGPRQRAGSGHSDPRSTAPIRLAWEGGFFETHSLALVNRELASAMLRRGQIELSIQLRALEPLHFDPQTDPRTASLLSYVDRSFEDGAEVCIRHAWPPGFERPSAGRWVMVQPWEFGRLPAKWVGPMRDEVDEIWAYSNAVRRVYIDSGVPAEKVFVVPAGVDAARFHPEGSRLELPTAKTFRFLFVGGTIWRKGADVLLNAYVNAFSRKDDVCLVIKDMGQDTFYRGQGAGEALMRLQADPNAPEILYLTEPMPDHVMPALYRACHCLVHPYRGEGFGLPVAEAMACGLPPIVTRGGACDDFCTDETVFWIPATRRSVQLTMETVGDAWVLEPDVGALITELRRAYETRQEVAARGAAASAWVREHLTWDLAADRALARLQVLKDEGQKAVRRPLPSATSPRPIPRQRFSLYHGGGGEDGQRAMFAPYVHFFSSCRTVLDVGCGPGTCLAMLQEHGIPAMGIDFDPAMVAACEARGLRAQVADASTVSSMHEEFDGIVASHIIEHMPGEAMVAFLESCVGALEPGGVLMVKTPNWANETVRHGGFWLDHTHVRPYPMPLLERIFEDLELEIIDKGAEPTGWNDLVIIGRKLGDRANG